MHHFLYHVFCRALPTSLCSDNTQNLPVFVLDNEDVNHAYHETVKGKYLLMYNFCDLVGVVMKLVLKLALHN